MLPSASLGGVGHAIAQFGEKGKGLRRQFEARRQAKQRPDPFDDLAGDAAGVPGRGAVAAGLRQACGSSISVRNRYFGLSAGIRAMKVVNTLSLE